MVRRDQQIKALSDQFINVRLVKCNSLDLNLFQFDSDLTFCVFFLDADKTIYARYGTRSGHDADKDVHIDGLAATMRAVLQLHRNKQKFESALAAKQPRTVDHSIPEEFPSLNHFKPELDYEGNVARSCIHCHQLRDAERRVYRNNQKAMPEQLLFPFPLPSVIGLELDKRTCSTISAVAPGSAAAKAGIETGDVLHSINNQLVHSEADVQWMLHQLDGTASQMDAVVLRADKRVNVTIPLPVNWRKLTDLSWRPTSWDLRRMATGGMTLKPVQANEQKQLALGPGKMALRATHVGMYGHHARARKAGLRKGDIIVSFDGRDDLMNEAAVFEHAIQSKHPGDEVKIRFLRDGMVKTTSLKLQ